MVTQSELMLGNWRQLIAIVENGIPVDLKGEALTIPALVAVCNYNTVPRLDNITQEGVSRIESSVRYLHQSLARGDSIYGVTTGFGGSANTHTSHTTTLQTALIQMQLSGILPHSDTAKLSTASPNQGGWVYHDALDKLAMPESWVRGAILVRTNSLLRGHSAVRLDIIQALLKLLECNLIPLVPLRGSISASGDLCPLSYVAGTLEGNPDVKVWSGKHESRVLITADEALRQAGLSPVSFGPKETLGLLNGTAFSTAVASLSHHEADTLAVLSQILTAMGVEALSGTAESFDAFIGAVRPHQGQMEIAANLRSFLKGSRFAHTRQKSNGSTVGNLRQDRYPLRTSPQWLGPFLEDMGLARTQLEVELNSTTDNPLIDVENQQIHHGGNFQATSVTSSTEKTRTALEKFGKMIFAQSTELLDSRLNQELPPNLAVDEPSLSYSMKGVDINMASYMSELSFLANPISNHVQSAEMCNQAINSLALLSARYTHMAVDVVSLMVSAHIYTLCQALDLRAMGDKFICQLRPAIIRLTNKMFREFMSEIQLSTLHSSICASFVRNLAATSSEDSSDRFVIIAQNAQHHILQAIQHAKLSSTSAFNEVDTLSLVESWTKQAAVVAKSVFCDNRSQYLINPDASEYLGAASKIMYNFVRNELKVPMHRGLVDHPTTQDGMAGLLKKNTGSQISIIYKALRDERLVVPMMECLKEAVEMKQMVELPSKL